MDELYPSIIDPRFQFIIASKREFTDLANPDGLYPHQEFIRRFMSPYTPYKSIILYHDLGSGKSIACIAVAVDHYLYDKKSCIIVTKGQSGTDNFLQQIQRYRDMCSSKSWERSIFTTEHYMSMCNRVADMTDEDVAATFSDKILVLDEVHNVRYLARDQDSIYSSIIRILDLCKNTKTLMATATPMTDNAEQITSLLGLCGGAMRGVVSYNPFVCDKPKATYKGRDDVVPGFTVWTSEMVAHQAQCYIRELERGVPQDIYRSLTHISLFCFEDGTFGRDIFSSKIAVTRHRSTITPSSTHRTKEIRYSKFAVNRDYSHVLSGEGLRRCSCKYSAFIDVIEKTTGNVFVFVEEVRGSGLLLLGCILENHGYELYIGEDLKRIPPRKRYTLCVGSSDISPNNLDRLHGFNDPANKNGEYVRILLGSKVIGESITLLNVRQFHCITPHWNDSTINQAVGRVVRNRSHNALPNPADRNVDIYIHISLEIESIDIKKLNVCKEKQRKIDSVQEQMKECAVDRYCIIEPGKEPVTDSRTFAAAYLPFHMDDILGRLYPHVHTTAFSYDIYDLSATLGIEPILFVEAVCRMIIDNTPFANDTLYLRAYENTVFAVEDPSLPSVTMPHPPPYDDALSLHTLNIEDVPEESKQSFLAWFRYMPVRQKAATLETFISTDRTDVLGYINTLYMVVEDTTYHILLYRDLESSYTSASPVPHKPSGKTRMFRDDRWSTVDATAERPILELYRRRLDALMKEIDRFDMYGIVSTIDGDMRLRLRDSTSYVDSRYRKRGRNIKSIKKDELVHLYGELCGPSDDATCMTINELTARIDNTFIDKDLYIVL